jgi:type IV pilus assembly protein PilC
MRPGGASRLVRYNDSVPAYRYQAKNRDGRRVGGTVQAASQDDAVAKLTAVGLFPFNVVDIGPQSRGDRAESFVPPADGGGPPDEGADGISFEVPQAVPDDVTRRPLASVIAAPFSYVSLYELALFCREMGAMLKAGLGLEGALSTILTGRMSAYLRMAVSDIARRVYSGGSLPEAMARYPRVFNRMFIGMVRAGEMTGNLDMIFAELATFYEEERTNKLAARVDFIFPGMTVATALAATAIFTFCLHFPGMRVLMDFIVWLILAVVAFFILNKTRAFTRVIRCFIEHFPVIGGIMRKRAIARLSFALGTMIRAGVPYLEALDIARDAAWLPSVERAVEDVYRGVRNGISIQESMSITRGFPPFVRNLVAVGEKAGTVDDVFFKIAEYYGTETKYQTQSLMRMILPLLTIAVGIIVAIILITFWGNYFGFIMRQVGND